ncbi:hypothetical protein [Clostridium vincentii]|uniref:Uncharacterized protein n=1 Tax=Clostridium vincentii TaxID=52704 RepID=A0A2T0BA82_9CLOT|nr:hypothetical protein [Clostridium vincentii]PRR80798.1 hypothetical protein CLVI_29640 [Clostridium vincentii]
MHKKNLEQPKKTNEESAINRGAGHYSIAGMINNDNGPTSKTKKQSDNESASSNFSNSDSSTDILNDTTSASSAGIPCSTSGSASKGHLDNEYEPNILASSVSNAAMATTMSDNTHDITLDENGKLKVLLTSNKTTN